MKFLRRFFRHIKEGFIGVKARGFVEGFVGDFRFGGGEALLARDDVLHIEDIEAGNLFGQPIAWPSDDGLLNGTVSTVLELVSEVGKAEIGVLGIVELLKGRLWIH